MVRKLPDPKHDWKELPDGLAQVRDSLMVHIDSLWEIEKEKELKERREFVTILHEAAQLCRYKNYNKVPSVVRTAVAKKLAARRVSNRVSEKAQQVARYQPSLKLDIPMRLNSHPNEPFCDMWEGYEDVTPF